MSEEAIEKMIVDAECTAPRVTLELIDSLIVDEQYHVFPGSCMTVCCLTLKNGFSMLGESGCADPANFRAEIGRIIAREKARNKIGVLEGYLLKQRVYSEQ